MPSSMSHWARSGWSEGPCPQMPTYLPALLQARMAMESMAFTASSRSSNRSAMRAESRSRPRVNWVMSLEPMEKPSKRSRNWSASTALEGISHIMMTLRPFLPRSRPLSRRRPMTASASSRVRTKGTMISTLTSPMSSRTRLTASHSISKQSRNESAI